MEKYFQNLREIGQAFGVSHQTLQARGIAANPDNPARGMLTIGPGTPGAIRMPCVRIGGQWAVATEVLTGVLQGLGAMPTKDVDTTKHVIQAKSVKKRPGRPRRKNRGMV